MNADAIRELKIEVDAINQIPAIHQILEVVCKVTGLGFAAVARVTDTRWIACAVKDDISFGLQPGGELPLETTICNEIRQHGQVVTIDEVSSDDQYCSHPVPMKYGFQSYISVPIVRSDGSFFGTLCGIDPRPIPLSKPETVSMFKLFGELIAMHLDSVRTLAQVESDLSNEKGIGVMREKYIAVLSHDLRNPLGAIASCGHLLKMVSKDPEITEIADTIDRSVKRMTEMIENVLDMARGKSSTGMVSNMVDSDSLSDDLTKVVEELRVSRPNRKIEFHALIHETVNCDAARLGQMLSNLLANALSHGSPDRPVTASAYTASGKFVMYAENEGPTIPPEQLETMFQPFTRGQENLVQDGLGLGLFICSEIAEAHGGALKVESKDGFTRFTFTMQAVR